MPLQRMRTTHSSDFGRRAGDAPMKISRLSFVNSAVLGRSGWKMSLALLSGLPIVEARGVSIVCYQSIGTVSIVSFTKCCLMQIKQILCFGYPSTVNIDNAIGGREIGP
jgi:hypothetical protein